MEEGSRRRVREKNRNIEIIKWKQPETGDDDYMGYENRAKIEPKLDQNCSGKTSLPFPVFAKNRFLKIKDDI